ncbi:hypothetical protein [Micavibrio aeruginosavorus]|uniref:hypothetical protein n=1 Tax=Micavibrio aeruginosavorus TaxID=349221 RepID=UPI003F4A8C36
MAFTDFQNEVDLSFLDKEKVSIDLLKKGQLRSNGKTVQRVNSVSIHLIQALPDEYDLRIDAMIEGIGGIDAVRKLVESYKAKDNFIVLGIPTRTGDTIEDSYISREMMQRLCSLNLDIHFYYT